MYINRRKFLQSSLAAWVGLYLKGCTPLTLTRTPSSLKKRLAEDIWPICRNPPADAASRFSGDQPRRIHSLLRGKKPGTFPPLPAGAKPELRRLVVVGGGISGLLTSYLLREYQPVILEQAARFGGNSQGEIWRSMPYALGAAYFSVPDKDSAISRLFAELGLQSGFAVRSKEDPVALQGKIVADFWEGASDPEHAESFRVIRSYLQRMAQPDLYPDWPMRDEKKKDRVLALDKVNFKQHLETINGGKLPEQLQCLIDYYCWSSFGASPEELSAAAGLNFICAEFDPLGAFPGGNAAIAERLLQKLVETLPPGSLRCQSPALQVRASGDKTSVIYVDPKGESKEILADAVVMACPKFVVKHLMPDLEPERLACIEQIRYRAYLVGNVLFNENLPSSFYDLPLLGTGKTTDAPGSRFTDLVSAGFAKSPTGQSVLTFYRAFPYDGARAQLYAPQALEEFRKDLESLLEKEVFPLFGLSRKSVEEIRLSRWGHPLPIAEPGRFVSGFFDTISRPFADRIFFIEQDNWCLPAFESAAAEAFFWTPQVKKRLRGSLG